MKLKSSAFRNNETIPKKYTCDGQDVNPPLTIEDIPQHTKEFALIVDDPDAPSKTWVHWVVYNMPVEKYIDEDSSPGTEGINDFSKTTYGGPCPPSGQHRYFFKLYALDLNLKLKRGITKKQLESEMEGHIIEKAQLVGLYPAE
jgi:Raf kinase inhibitor-like YbhB/YbcL family protein